MDQPPQSTIEPTTLIRTRRKITGMSAVLLPFLSGTEVDWNSFHRHVIRTNDAGLIPAINMDTGYVNLIDDALRKKILLGAADVLDGSEFLAGAFVTDQEGSPFDLDAYRRQIDSIGEVGGTPIIFQSFGLAHGFDSAVVDNYQQIARYCPRFYAFELGSMFAPFGRIYSLDTFRKLMQIPECIGAKHSSLRRDLEWQRIQLRDELRLEFQLLTGNDLAIDMVMYGSDYLLGLSTFCPAAFARRDAMWESGDAGFYQLNDILQYLGNFAFRHPTAAYKHSAAMFLKLQDMISTDLSHPDGLQRPESDRGVLREILDRLNAGMLAK